VVEFDKPHTLLARKDGYFSGLVDSLEKAEAAKLRASAREVR